MEYSIDSYYTEGDNVFMIFKNKKKNYSHSFTLTFFFIVAYRPHSH